MDSRSGGTALLCTNPFLQRVHRSRSKPYFLRHGSPRAPHSPQSAPSWSSEPIGNRVLARPEEPPLSEGAIEEKRDDSGAADHAQPEPPSDRRGGIVEPNAVRARGELDAAEN